MKFYACFQFQIINYYSINLNWILSVWMQIINGIRYMNCICSWTMMTISTKSIITGWIKRHTIEERLRNIPERIPWIFHKFYDHQILGLLDFNATNINSRFDDACMHSFAHCPLFIFSCWFYVFIIIVRGNAQTPCEFE